MKRYSCSLGFDRAGHNTGWLSYAVKLSGRCQKKHECRCLDVLRQPADTFTVALSHDNTAHEDFDGTDALERNLALAGGLVETKLVSLLSLLVTNIL